MGSGENGDPKKEKSLDILPDALLSVKANRIGWAFISQGERMSRVREVVFRLFDPFHEGAIGRRPHVGRQTHPYRVPKKPVNGA